MDNNNNYDWFEDCDYEDCAHCPFRNTDACLYDEDGNPCD